LIRDLVNILASSLQSSNAWLTAIRSVGYHNRVALGNGGFVVSANGVEIGLSDTDQNSGYIRFRGDIRFEDKRRMASCNFFKTKIIVPLRLVVVSNTMESESLAWAMATQINSTVVTVDSTAVRFNSIQAGGNTPSIVMEETGKEDWNAELNVFFVDFSAEFLWNSDCDLPVNFPEMCGCANTLDLGCVDSCSELLTAIIQSGTVTMKTSFDGVSQSVIIPDLRVDHKIVIPVSYLNESYTYSLKFYNSDGVALTLAIADVEYDCFTLKITPLA